MNRYFVLDELRLLDLAQLDEATIGCKIATYHFEQQLHTALKRRPSAPVICLHTDPRVVEVICRRLHEQFPGSLILPFSGSLSALTYESLIKISPELKDSLPEKLFGLIKERMPAFGVAAAARPDDSIIGSSSAIQQVFEELSLIASTGFHVMIYGESGTGKEAIARKIHRESSRSNGPFVAIDCGCLMNETAMSELFGYVKGAFTDAFSDKGGAFEQANNGTLFLDEVGNLSYEVQIGLLRAIQEQAIRKIGSVREVAVDVRIITATNEALSVKGDRSSFRQDLFYRLNEFSIELPPLRARKEDIAAIAAYFIEKACSDRGVSPKELPGDVLEVLEDYQWPGNIRELRNVIRRCCLLAQNRLTIHLDDLPAELSPSPRFRAVNDEHEKQPGLKNSMQRAEYEQIITALQATQYNKRKAAILLNIHRKTLYNKLKQMERPDQV